MMNVLFSQLASDGYPQPTVIALMDGESNDTTCWHSFKSIPLMSGLYEVQGHKNGRAYFYWSGKLWLTRTGAAVHGAALKKSKWRGLTEAGHLRACQLLNVNALARRHADGQGQTGQSEFSSVNAENRDIAINKSDREMEPLKPFPTDLSQEDNAFGFRLDVDDTDGCGSLPMAVKGPESHEKT